MNGLVIVLSMVLAIAYQENLAKARFFTGSRSYELANRLELIEFDLAKMTREIKEPDSSVVVFDEFLGNLIIDTEAIDWHDGLNSDNIFSGGFKQIAPIEGEYVRKIYSLED